MEKEKIQDSGNLYLRSQEERPDVENSGKSAWHKGNQEKKGKSDNQH